MKRTVAIWLLFAIVFGLCACGTNGEQDNSTPTAPAGLQVGYARESILPEESVPLGGYGNSESRMSTGYVDILYGTCLAISQGDETLLMFSQDLIRANPAWVAELRQKITAQTGIPGDHIMVCATHTHAGPDTLISHSAIATYKILYMDAMVAAANAALADLSPATLYGGTAETVNMNFVRHYKMSDGSYAGDNFGDFNKTIVGHATEGDPEMVLVKIDREGDKQDILLMNFQAHPCKVGGGSANTNISADFVGSTRDAFEKETGMLFIYFTGAAGNQNATSRIPEENNSQNLKEYGKSLADYAIDALEGMKKLEGDGIKTSQIMFEYACNHENEDKAPQAQEVYDLYRSSGADAANALAQKYGLDTWLNAKNLLSHSSYPESSTMELNAIYACGIAFITAPYEMFSDAGLYIKENSPFETTVICTCANAGYNYLPTAAAFDYGSYEGYHSYFAKGGAEAAAEEFVKMLNSLK